MKKLLTILILPLLVASFFLFHKYQKDVEGFDEGKKVPIFIEYGTTTKEIVSILKEKGIIETEWPMLVYLKWYKESNNLQAGDFIIKQGTPIPELVDILSHARTTEIPIRIIEGQTIEEIDELLFKKELTQKGEFIECTKKCDFSDYNFINNNSLEGFLFPDTYFVEIKNFNTQSFIKRLLNNFQNRFLSEENISIYTKQGRSLYDIVIMASIIEKEEWNTENMPIVSGILWKRLDERIHLGADATTRYYENKSTEKLTKEDFSKNNPYNTRRVLGLPPTAIGNPGLKALNATLYPEKSKYYYYLHDGNGNIHYSVTNDEHNDKRTRYIN